MLCALISLEIDKQAVTLDDIQQATRIPMETLQAYENGTAAIPVEIRSKFQFFWAFKSILFTNPYG